MKNAKAIIERMESQDRYPAPRRTHTLTEIVVALIPLGCIVLFILASMGKIK